MYQQVFQLHENLYKALANQKRVEIIHLLREHELSVTQIQRMLGLPQANLSQHLAVLREQGLVKARRNGTTVYYRLAHPNLIRASDLIREMLVEQNRTNSNLAEELRLRMKDLVPLVSDPICGMRVSPKTAAAVVKFGGKTIYFCAGGCKKIFINKMNSQKNKKRKKTGNER